MSKGLQTLEFSFEGDALTHFGGLFLIQRFCNQLRLRRRLQRILKAPPHWIDYRPEDMILMFLYVLVAGIQRVNKTEILQYHGLFLSLIGLKRFPGQARIGPAKYPEFNPRMDRIKHEWIVGGSYRRQKSRCEPFVQQSS